jgi:hypothetical protein
MTLVLTILGGVFAAAVAAVLAHRLTSRRDQTNRRNDLRVEYLVGAYRVIADTSHRDLDPGAEHVRAFEQGLSDIQLLGSRVQAEMAVLVSKQLAATGSADLDDLLLSLRDDLREELQLEPLTQMPFHVRVISND